MEAADLVRAAVSSELDVLLPLLPCAEMKRRMAHLQSLTLGPPQLQVPTDVLLRMTDGGAKKLKQSAIENLLQLSLPQVPVSALRVASQCCGVTASSKPL